MTITQSGFPLADTPYLTNKKTGVRDSLAITLTFLMSTSVKSEAMMPTIETETKTKKAATKITTTTNIESDSNINDYMNRGERIELFPKGFVPGNHDVMIGRGKKCFSHEGNLRLRNIAAEKLDEYSVAPSKARKSDIVSNVLNLVRAKSPQGGFVKLHPPSGRWFEVGETLAREKVSQVFRDLLYGDYRSSNLARNFLKKMRQEKKILQTGNPQNKKIFGWAKDMQQQQQQQPDNMHTAPSKKGNASCQAGTLSSFVNRQAKDIQQQQQQKQQQQQQQQQQPDNMPLPSNKGKASNSCPAGTFGSFINRSSTIPKQEEGGQPNALTPTTTAPPRVSDRNNSMEMLAMVSKELHKRSIMNGAASDQDPFFSGATANNGFSNYKKLPPGTTPKNNKRLFVKHNYRDHSVEEPLVEEMYLVEPSYTRTPHAAFPLLLHETLSQIEADGYGNIVGWLPHGRSFKIHEQEDFVDIVLPKYFVMTKKNSFLRQLNLYGFHRLSRMGPDQGSYYHEKFLRGMKFLCQRMARQKVNGNGIRAAGNPDEEPVLSQYPDCPPVRKGMTSNNKKNMFMVTPPAAAAIIASPPGMFPPDIERNAYEYFQRMSFLYPGMPLPDMNRSYKNITDRGNNVMIDADSILPRQHGPQYPKLTFPHLHHVGATLLSQPPTDEDLKTAIANSMLVHPLLLKAEQEKRMDLLHRMAREGEQRNPKNTFVIGTGETSVAVDNAPDVVPIAESSDDAGSAGSAREEYAQTLLKKRCMRTYGWNRSLTDRVWSSYQQFFELKHTLKDWDDTLLSPSLLVGQMWQQHVLDNRRYKEHCKSICAQGKIVYYNPDGTADREQRIMSTKMALKVRFADQVDWELWGSQEEKEKCSPSPSHQKHKNRSNDVSDITPSNHSDTTSASSDTDDASCN